MATKSYRPGGGEMICPRLWRIYVRPRTGPQSASLCTVADFFLDKGRIGADSTGATGNFAPVLTQEPGKRCVLPRYLSWLCSDFLSERCSSTCKI